MKVTREPGVAALTAGPGVTNGISAIAVRAAEPLAGARARRSRSGDAVGPRLAPGDRPRPVRTPAREAGGDGVVHRRPIPGADRRRVGGHAARRIPVPRSWTSRSTWSSWRPRRRPPPPRPRAARPRADAAAARPSDGAPARRRAPGRDGRHRPLLGPRERALARAGRGRGRAGVPERARPRGCLPADHECSFSRARGAALKAADVAVVAGVPMDFRLGFGEAFGEHTEIHRRSICAEPSATTRARWRPSATGTSPRRSGGAGRARRGPNSRRLARAPARAWRRPSATPSASS